MFSLTLHHPTFQTRPGKGGIVTGKGVESDPKPGTVYRVCTCDPLAVKDTRTEKALMQQNLKWTRQLS